VQLPIKVENLIMGTASRGCLKAVIWALLIHQTFNVLRAQPAPPPQAAPSLQEQLEAQYPLAKLAPKGGCTVTNPETALAMQQAGIGALPQNTSWAGCAAHYREGHITKTGFRCNSWLNMSKQTLVMLEKGDKVFPTKIETVKDDVKISFGYCSGNPGQAAAYAGQVVIEFPKDTLKNASVSQVEDKIAEVFAPGAEKAEVQQTQAQSAGDQAEPSAQANAPEPQSIEQGQTVEQVVAALGQPTQIFKAGSKQIYVYKTVKITFIDGKVSGIE
jgi:hypothetical protein